MKEPIKKIMENIRNKLAVKEDTYGNESIQNDYECLSTILIRNGSRYGVYVDSNNIVEDTPLKTQIRLAMEYYHIYYCLQKRGCRLFPSLQLELIKFYKNLKASIDISKE